MSKFYSFFKGFTFIITTILILIILFIVLTSNKDEKINDLKNNPSCIDLNNVSNLEYAACFDAFSQTIFFEVKNINLISNDALIQVSFFDYLQKTYSVEIPTIEKSIYQRIPSQTNPFSIDIFLEDSKNTYCNIPKQIQVSYCPADLSNSSEGTLELISKTNLENFKEIGNSGNDRLEEDLVDKERIWESICKSNWECGSWGNCVNNIEKRECIDKTMCGIPTNVPVRVRTCNVDCVENWQCEWSNCIEGYTVPSCVDLNSCNTQINKPSKLACNQKCEPDIVCSSWGECEADYSFLTLTNGDYILSGTQKRECIDKNNCIGNSFDSQSCLLTIDIYTKETIKCGKEYINIYNSLDNKFIATIEKNKEKDIVNIDLSNEKFSYYCDYCFDGLLNGDEEQIDCGGSCESCDTLRVNKDFSKTFVQRMFEKIKDFLS